MTQHFGPAKKNQHILSSAAHSDGTGAVGYASTRLVCHGASNARPSRPGVHGYLCTARREGAEWRYQSEDVTGTG